MFVQNPRDRTPAFHQAGTQHSLTHPPGSSSIDRPTRPSRPKLRTPAARWIPRRLGTRRRQTAPSPLCNHLRHSLGIAAGVPWPRRRLSDPTRPRSPDRQASFDRCSRSGTRPSRRTVPAPRPQAHHRRAPRRPTRACPPGAGMQAGCRRPLVENPRPLARGPGSSGPQSPQHIDRLSPDPSCAKSQAHTVFARRVRNRNAPNPRRSSTP